MNSLWRGGSFTEPPGEYGTASLGWYLCHLAEEVSLPILSPFPTLPPHIFLGFSFLCQKPLNIDIKEKILWSWVKMY